MLVNRFFIRSSRLLLGFLTVLTCFVSAGDFIKVALASSGGPVLLEMPIYDRISSDDLIGQAESMVSQEIDRRFNLDSGLAEVEVVVLGSRNGDVIPVLTTAVSRAQWQENPQVSAWTRYHSAYALIRRHDKPQPAQVAARPSRRTSTVTSGGDISIQFDRQFDSGRLSGRTVQAYADLID